MLGGQNYYNKSLGAAWFIPLIGGIVNLLAIIGFPIILDKIKEIYYRMQYNPFGNYETLYNQIYSDYRNLINVVNVLASKILESGLNVKYIHESETFYSYLNDPEHAKIIFTIIGGPGLYEVLYAFKKYEELDKTTENEDPTFQITGDYAGQIVNIEKVFLCQLLTNYLDYNNIIKEEENKLSTSGISGVSKYQYTSYLLNKIINLFHRHWNSALITRGKRGLAEVARLTTSLSVNNEGFLDKYFIEFMNNNIYPNCIEISPSFSYFRKFIISKNKHLLELKRIASEEKRYEPNPGRLLHNYFINNLFYILRPAWTNNFDLIDFYLDSVDPIYKKKKKKKKIIPNINNGDGKTPSNGTNISPKTKKSKTLPLLATGGLGFLAYYLFKKK